MPVLLPEERPPAPVTLSEAAVPRKARQQDPQIRQETIGAGKGHCRSPSWREELRIKWHLSDFTAPDA